MIMTETIEQTKEIVQCYNDITICAISDLHGNLIDNIAPCDLVLICGDSVSLQAQGSSKRTKKWYLDEFKPWAENLPCDKVLFIAGNHELHFSKNREYVLDAFSSYDKVTYLENDAYTFTKLDKSIHIYGTPYCKQFGNWAFMESNIALEYIYSLIPDNVDILMCHDCPYGCNDVLLDKYMYTGEHIGNKPLRDAIEQRNINTVFTGHLHSVDKTPGKINETTVINCSILNEEYNVTYKPQYIII